ncbi:DUF4350 domain-containing protein [[Eubacterium] cellulosolvens]
MQRKVLFILIILLVIIISTPLCFESDDEPKPRKERVWHDLTNLKDFLEQNYEVTIKDESGAAMIKSIEDPEGAVYLVVGVDEPFTEAEAAALHHFVESGGNLIVAADDHKVNNLSKRFGVEYSIHSILDKRFDYNYTFIPVVATSNSNQFTIIVHSPRGLEITAADYEIIGKSSEYPDTITSVLDMNDNRIIDAPDQPGPIPIIVEVNIKSGQAIFISDAGLFSDNLWQLVSISDKPEYEGLVYQNQEFFIDLLSNRYESGKMLVYDRSKQTASFSNFHPYPTPE